MTKKLNIPLIPVFEVRKLNDEYYPYGLYYNGSLVSGLTSNSNEIVKETRKKVEKELGL